MKKARWAIQDPKGLIAVLGKGSNPTFDTNSKVWIITGDKWEVISRRYDLNVKAVLVDLKEFDYEIRDGILCSVAKPEPHVHQKAIKAWADGATIQYRCPSDGGGWEDCVDNAPRWSPDCDYRVKPKDEC